MDVDMDVKFHIHGKPGTIPDPLRPPLPLDWGSQPHPKTAIVIISGKAKAPIMAHRAVIFAIAELSCFRCVLCRNDANGKSV